MTWVPVPTYAPRKFKSESSGKCCGLIKSHDTNKDSELDLLEDTP